MRARHARPCADVAAVRLPSQALQRTCKAQLDIHNSRRRRAYALSTKRPPKALTSVPAPALPPGINADRDRRTLAYAQAAQAGGAAGGAGAGAAHAGHAAAMMMAGGGTAGGTAALLAGWQLPDLTSLLFPGLAAVAAAQQQQQLPGAGGQLAAGPTPAMTEDLLRACLAGALQQLQQLQHPQHPPPGHPQQPPGAQQ
jgi:hypothetical protein